MRMIFLQLIGRKTLRIGDVQNITSFKLEKSVMTSIFSATVTSNIKAAFTNSMEYSSFLTGTWDLDHCFFRSK